MLDQAPGQLNRLMPRAMWRARPHRQVAELRVAHEEFRKSIADPERQEQWATILARCGSRERADVVLAAALRRGKRNSVPPLERGKDHDVRAPRPDGKLVDWLRSSRAKWLRSLPKDHPLVSISRHCEQCGVRVTVGRRARRAWCSASCSQAWHNARRPPVQHDQRTCVECQQAFRPTRADAKFCSAGCRQRAYRKREAGQVVSITRHAQHAFRVPQWTTLTIPDWVNAPRGAFDSATKRSPNASWEAFDSGVNGSREPFSDGSSRKSAWPVVFRPEVIPVSFGIAV